MVFLVKKCSMRELRATQIKPADQVKNISKFGCQGHILQGSKKNLNSSLSFGQAALLPFACLGHFLLVLRLIHTKT